MADDVLNEPLQSGLALEDKPPSCQSAQEHVAFCPPRLHAAGLAGMQLQLQSLKLPGHSSALSSLFEL